jgi:hypothetical protein
VARVSAKKTAARKTTRKSTARKSTARGRARSTTATKATTAAKATAAAPAAPAAGTVDLAGGLRSLLDSVETEVRAVSSLSERIDTLVTELNRRRDEQAKRLIVLDALRESVNDQSLGAFLDKAIRPRRPRVTELMPERLTRD